MTTETKQYGFLPTRLGKKVVYCNRKYGGLWYTIQDGKPQNIEGASFRSLPGGLLGLSFYSVERGGKVGWKCALMLLGPGDQVYHFESGAATIFCRGLIWGLCHASKEQLKGEIGINPTPADPTRVDSKNVQSILYCNVFANGIELPYFPGGTQDWRSLAALALELCNNAIPTAEQIPEASAFSDDEDFGFSKKQYTAPLISDNAQSGVSYPTPKPKMPATAVNAPSVDIDGYYNSLYTQVNKAYTVLGLEIDPVRLASVFARANVQDYTELPIARKHQVLSSIVKELASSQLPGSPAIAELTAICEIQPLTFVAYQQLKKVTDEVTAACVPF